MTRDESQPTYVGHRIMAISYDHSVKDLRPPTIDASEDVMFSESQLPSLITRFREMRELGDVFDGGI